MIEHKQFDTIYHEHFSYLSLKVVAEILAKNGLRVFDVEEWPTHGGSLRVFSCLEAASHRATASVDRCLAEERAAGLSELSGYTDFAEEVVAIRCATLKALSALREAGKVVVGAGAAAKGNTFLNYCGIGPELARRR